MTPSKIKEFCPLNKECLELLRQSVNRLNLSARSFFRLIKVSRTIADLEDKDEISVENLAEALQYRPRGESY